MTEIETLLGKVEEVIQDAEKLRHSLNFPALSSLGFSSKDAGDAEKELARKVSHTSPDYVAYRWKEVDGHKVEVVYMEDDRSRTFQVRPDACMVYVLVDGKVAKDAHWIERDPFHPDE